MGCIDQRGAGVGSGGAGDAVCMVERRIGKPSRRGDRAAPVDPKGRVFKVLGRRLPPLAMQPGQYGASPRDAILAHGLAQGLENTVQPVIMSRTGS